MKVEGYTHTLVVWCLNQPCAIAGCVCNSFVITLIAQSPIEKSATLDNLTSDQILQQLQKLVEKPELKDT